MTDEEWQVLQAKEFDRLLANKHVYVDYTGGGQCPATVLNQYHDLLLTNAFGNPHSHNPTSKYTTELIESIRETILEYLHAGDDYAVIFTQNASGALKILGESYPWDQNTVYVLSRDNHNSVLGIREYAKRSGATIHYWELEDNLRLKDTLGDIIAQYPDKKVVVAFPAQSNFSGVMHPLDYTQQAHELGATVWLDAAAYIPTHELNLQQWRPEAICVSFYKILGFPTGIGALVIRKDFLETLRKAWFAGGTVRGVSLDDFVLEPNSHETFEDGTVNYALIPALQFVFQYIKDIGGIQVIEKHVTRLTAYALDQLKQLQLEKKVVIYGPDTMDQHGATIAFNMLDAQGDVIPYNNVEQLAYENNISLRGGCFCNPGAGSKAMQLEADTMKDLLQKVKTHSKEEVGVPGAIRISFGIGNSMEDVNAVIRFVNSVQ